jgi:histone H3/H4
MNFLAGNIFLSDSKPATAPAPAPAPAPAATTAQVADQPNLTPAAAPAETPAPVLAAPEPTVADPIVADSVIEQQEPVAAGAAVANAETAIVKIKASRKSKSTRTSAPVKKTAAKGADEEGTKRRRSKPGKKTIRLYKKLSGQSGLISSRAPFRRACRSEVSHQCALLGMNNKQMSKSFVTMLQAYFEGDMTKLFTASYKLSTHRGVCTLSPKDVHAAIHVRELFAI